MDIEQLKLILDAVGAAGEGAFWLTIIWLGQGYLEIIAWAVTIPLAIYWLFKGISNLVFGFSEINAIGRIVTNDQSFTVDYYGDRKKLIEWIHRRLKEDQ